MRALALLLLVGCASSAPAPSHDDRATPVTDADREAALTAARTAATDLATTLKTRLVGELGTNGPLAAATVCSTEAGTMAAEVTGRTGAVVGRSSLRLRNPANAAPPWVAEWLAAQGERPAEGVTGIERVDVTPEGEVARVLRPIAVDAPCLACHGPADSLAEGVPALLAEKYPSDAATGYAVGDLRGALYAEVAVHAAE